MLQVSSGTSSRAVNIGVDDEADQGGSHTIVSKNIGGIMYLPEYLLDCVLLCDSLREPNLLREVVGRLAPLHQSQCSFHGYGLFQNHELELVFVLEGHPTKKYPIEPVVWKLCNSSKTSPDTGQ